MCLCHFAKKCPGTIGKLDRLFPTEEPKKKEFVNKDCNCLPGYSYLAGRYVHKGYCDSLNRRVK